LYEFSLYDQESVKLQVEETLDISMKGGEILGVH